MTKLDLAPEIQALAESLSGSAKGGAVNNILHYCHKKIQDWLSESPVTSIDQLESLICAKLNLTIEEVRSCEDLQAVCQKYIAQKEFIFAYVHKDLDDDTYATLVERKQVPANAPDKYVAIIDCRHDKASRRFFTRWHEIAHILTLNKPLEGALHRSSSKNEQSPSERLMDTIAAEVGFYPALFNPILKAELSQAGHLTFKGVERIRSIFSKQASFLATLQTCLNRATRPTAWLECGLGFTKDEQDELNSKQLMLIPEAKTVPQPKLRLLSARHNSACKKKLCFHRQMSVPLSSLIHSCHNGNCEEPQPFLSEEKLSIWRHSNGSCLGYDIVIMEIKKVGDKIWALVTL